MANLLGPLTGAILQTIQALPRDDAEAESAAAIDVLAAELASPLRVAVAGRVKAGKSTLINALLRQRAAATDAGECTKVVTVFRYGFLERADIVLLGGERRVLPWRGGLPDRLGVELEEVDRVEVTLSNELLRHFTLIDTPGLASVNDQYSAAARQFLFDVASGKALASADAVLFILNDRVREDEVEALRSLRTVDGGDLGAGVSTYGILTRVDHTGEPDQLRAEVDELSRAHARLLRDYVRSVVPVLGLLAETAEAAMLAPEDLRSLQLLAGLSRQDLESCLLGVDEFRDAANLPLPLDARDRMLALLDLHGIEEAVNLYREGANSIPKLERALSGISGVTALREQIVDEFTANADALRARWALQRLTDIAYTMNGVGRSELLDRIEELSLKTVMHGLATWEARQAVLSGAVELPGSWRAELLRITGTLPSHERFPTTRDAPTLASVAVDGIRRWRAATATTLAPLHEQVARTAVRCYEIACTEARGHLEALSSTTG